MNKDKWNSILLEEIGKYERDMVKVNGPEDWAEEKQKLLTLIQNVDQATEVYNMENNIKG